MSTALQDPRTTEKPNYLNTEYGWKSWLFTKDHKRIAVLYLISITLMFVLGGIFALLIRLELLTPQGDLVNSDTYNKFFTMHGVVMVFFFLIPSIPATLGNFFVPMMIGAKDLAFPRINLLSWYIYVVGGWLRAGRDRSRRRRYRLDLLHAVQQHLFEHVRHHRGGWRLHRGLLVDPDGTELHRYGTQDASSRHDLGPASACLSGPTTLPR